MKKYFEAFQDFKKSLNFFLVQSAIRNLASISQNFRFKFSSTRVLKISPRENQKGGRLCFFAGKDLKENSKVFEYLYVEVLNKN